MTIHRIRVENVKGAKFRDIHEDILANKPSLIVAPNGFGKSSITAAFSSLIQSRLKLDDSLLHEGKKINKPSLSVEISDANGDKITLSADESKNDIFNHFDVFVINSRLQPKAIKRNMGGFTTASASLEIRQVVLVDKIPKTAHFAYSAAQAKALFGKNGKCLPNIDFILRNYAAIDELSKVCNEISKISGVKIGAELAKVLLEINGQNGDTTSILNWIDQNKRQVLENLSPLSLVANILDQHVPEINDRVTALLAAYQICNLYTANPKSFKESCDYVLYSQEKEIYKKLITSFDTTWRSIQPRESKGKLLVEFPEALYISNGQRDSLVFASMIQRVKGKIGKKNAIVVIDEVFDYLDDANLTAVQYYISNLIEDVKKLGKKVYPLIFTHLNPLYFRNYAFQDQKVYFIDKRKPKINEHFQRLINKREDATIKSDLERYHLHFSPTEIDIQSQFEQLGIKKTWGKSEVFRNHLNAEWQKYLTGAEDYDPFAVCCYVRVRIEEKIYHQIADSKKVEFINTNGTKNKLNFAKSLGISIPEVCYLLGVIYNEGLHIKQHADNSSPIVAKLTNLTIRKMVIEATGTQ